jgi:hypothetical protein
MKICPRCYKEIDDVHTCTPKSSDCCKSSVVIVGGRFLHDPEKGEECPIKRDKTYYYMCKKCEKPCDLVYGKVKE